MLTKPVYKELTIHKDNNKITEHRALPKGKAELVNPTLQLFSSLLGTSGRHNL
jgi:hypothetical protein